MKDKFYINAPLNSGATQNLINQVELTLVGKVTDEQFSRFELVQTIEGDLEYRLDLLFSGNMLRKHEVDQEEIVKVPKTWWDGFKLAWFPPVLLKKFPAEMRKINCLTVEYVVNICPHLSNEDISTHNNWMKTNGIGGGIKQAPPENDEIDSLIRQKVEEYKKNLGQHRMDTANLDDDTPEESEEPDEFCPECGTLLTTGKHGVQCPKCNFFYKFR